MCVCVCGYEAMPVVLPHQWEEHMPVLSYVPWSLKNSVCVGVVCSHGIKKQRS